MAAHNMSRKRPAPGAEPVGYPQQMQQSAANYNPALGPQLSNDEFLQWGQASAQPQNTYQDPSNYNIGQQNFPQPNISPLNQVARRPMTQIVTRPNMNSNQWMQDPITQMQQMPQMPVNPPNPVSVNGGWDEDIEELERKAQAAKRDAALKRKQIPPFVMKLRSFVEDEKNNDLIRWTEDGKSFVVLDEDEFARKLIPELFKHNNYASFVRQLNMYGFHKKVGLSDNSMRASERKSKSPSEYSNPYFISGHPELMWLIQKPKNVTSGTKGKGRTKAEDENPEDVDEVPEEPTNERARIRPQLTLGDGSATSLTEETLQSVQRELQLIRRQQAQISQIMAGLKHEHEQLYKQAVTFQDQHTRHENSINAILTFLATIYNRSLSGNDAAQGIANMFSSALPQDNSKSGTVVDVGDYNFDQLPIMDDMNNKPFKRPQLLLTDGQNRATTMSPASNSSPLMRSSRQPSQKPPNSPQIQEVFDNGNGTTNNNNAAYNQNSRVNGNQRNQQDMMSVIENANARNPSPTTPVADFTNVLNDLEHSRGNSPLSNAQRENVLRMINNSANQSGDNALINSNPPSGPANFDRRLANTKADLDVLAKMQAQQDQSVEKLTNLLQPLSPSGSIPGINDNTSLPPLDIEDFLTHNEYFADFPSDGNGNLDFSNGNTNGNNNGFSWDDQNADDDELFADVDTNYQDQNPPIKHEYDNSGNYLEVAGHDGGGRVESVASSEVTTPKHSSIADDELHSSKGKGRKLSTVDEPNIKKRRRS